VRREKASVCVARAVGVELRVVTDHHHTIPGERAIKFEPAYTELYRPGKTGQGVLGPQAACTAMALKVKHGDRA
jgi:hypothetical protein